MPEGKSDFPKGGDFGELNLFQLFDLIFRSWRTLAVCTTVALFIGIISLHMATPLYTVKMIVAKPPVPLEERTTTKSLAEGLLGGLGSQSAELNNFVSLLSTYRLSEALADNPQLMHSIFRKEWDEESERWHSPGFSTKRFILNVVRFLSGQPQLDWQQPDAVRLLGYLDENLKITQDPATALVTIEIDVARPEDGLLLLNSIYRSGERLLRTEFIDYHKLLIRQINAKLATVQVSDYRTNLLEILADSEKKVMILESDLPYVASLFQPPRSSAAPTAPAVNLVIALSILGGLLFGVVVVIVRLQLRQGRTKIDP